MSQKREYTISVIEEQDVDEVIALIKRTFYIDEPLNEAVGLCSEGPNSCPELDEYCTHDLLQGLCLKAVNQQGKIISVMVNGECPIKEDENGNDMLSQAKKCTNPKFQKILHIIAQREAGAKLWELFPDDKTLVEIKVAATDVDWRRKGIMNALIEETEKIMKQRGLRLLRLDTSSAYSAMAAERLGFTCVYKARYTDIKLDGKPLIVPKPPHIEDKVHIKALWSK